ncbi:MAG: transposase [Phycisphaeraceae bacterium]|nr:transposase [Phycisphaeraceae bacterium]
MPGSLAYFLTFHTYGTWLHGREEGSVDHEHREPGQPYLPANEKQEASRHAHLKHAVFLLDESRREVVLSSVRETCTYREWRLLAVHVRENHVHVVVSAIAPVEKVLRDLKAYATRNLRKQNLLTKEAPAWTEHGSTLYLWNEDKVAEKCHYTLHEQGRPMQCWPTPEG